jgi:hypothetical protein
MLARKLATPLLMRPALGGLRLCRSTRATTSWRRGHASGHGRRHPQSASVARLLSSPGGANVGAWEGSMRLRRSALALPPAFASLRVAAHAKIPALELANPLETLPIEDDDPAPLEGQQLPPAQRLKAAIDVHGAEPEGVGDLRLRQRQPRRSPRCLDDEIETTICSTPPKQGLRSAA